MERQTHHLPVRYFHQPMIVMTIRATAPSPKAMRPTSSPPLQETATSAFDAEFGN